MPTPDPLDPEFDTHRLDAMEAALCAFVPHEERFDRITREVRQQLRVPIALVSMVERDVQWFRSAQGLTAGETPRGISFCQHAVLGKSDFMQVDDATTDPRFAENPLVTGDMGLRAYLGIPLTLPSGDRAGTLCALDTRPRAFTPADVAALKGLAREVEQELGTDPNNRLQTNRLKSLAQQERRERLDSATGCWNARGFAELAVLAAHDAEAQQQVMALCYVRPSGLDLFDLTDPARTAELRHSLAQALRRRLPADGSLAAIGTADFCALLPGPNRGALERQIAEFTVPQLEVELPGAAMPMSLAADFGIAFGGDVVVSPADRPWQTAVERLPG